MQLARTSQLIGNPMVTADEELVGTVDAVVIDRRERQVTGVIAGQGVREALAVRFTDLSLDAGTDTRLVIAAGRSPALASRLFPAEGVLEQPDVIGTEALSDRGMALGIVRDIEIDMTTGAITAVELLTDIAGTIRTLPATRILRLGSEYTLISDEEGRGGGPPHAHRNAPGAGA